MEGTICRECHKLPEAIQVCVGGLLMYTCMYGLLLIHVHVHVLLAFCWPTPYKLTVGTIGFLLYMYCWPSPIHVHV